MPFIGKCLKGTLLLILFFNFTNIVKPQTPTPTTEGATDFQKPCFLFFHHVQFKEGKAPKTRKEYVSYFHNLIKKIGDDASKKVFQGEPVTIPESLVRNEFFPEIGQELWKFDSSLGCYGVKKSKVIKYQTSANPFAGGTAEFETDDNISNDEEIYVLTKKDENPDSVYHEQLSLREINDVMSGDLDPLVGDYGKDRNEVLRKISNFKIDTAISIGSLGAEILTLSENHEQYIDGLTFIKFKDRLLIESGYFFDGVMVIAKEAYFILYSSGTGTLEISIFKLSGEKLEKIYSDGTETD